MCTVIGDLLLSGINEKLLKTVKEKRVNLKEADSHIMVISF